MPWEKHSWRPLLPITAERGYLIPAIDKPGTTQYLECAQLLAHTIRRFHPGADITVLVADQLPLGDLGGYRNDWQCWLVSPYRQTIKLEADMIVAGPVDHWWTLFEHRDVVVSLGARNFYDEVTTCRRYRKVFDVNNLPDVYNAITYWRVSETAQQFFTTVKNIFAHWTDYSSMLKFPDPEPTTDVVYALASIILGPESVTLPSGLGPQIVHMKPGVVPLSGRDWTQELIWEQDPFRINTVAQWGFVHYHIKSWRP